MGEKENRVKSEIRKLAVELDENYNTQGLFNVQIGEKLPNREAIISLVDDLKKITFPGFFGKENMAYVPKEDFAGNTLSVIYEKLFRQIRTALSYGKAGINYDEIAEKSEELALTFLREIPRVQALLLKDVDAELNGDPAANSKAEVICSYPGVLAILVYRYAHVLYELGVPFIPRIMTEHAHGLTGIDINPGAKIGEYFFIDHGTGIVIGETTEIGDRVKIYQGVTLGALSTRKGQELSGVKRHPTIEDDVVIYSNTTVLGGETVIGARSVVAGNTFVTSSIPADTKVASTMPELELKKKRRPPVL